LDRIVSNYQIRVQKGEDCPYLLGQVALRIGAWATRLWLTFASGRF
jgi:hypothetical protein